MIRSTLLRRAWRRSKPYHLELFAMSVWLVLLLLATYTMRVRQFWGSSIALAIAIGLYVFLQRIEFEAREDAQRDVVARERRARVDARNAALHLAANVVRDWPKGRQNIRDEIAAQIRTYALPEGVQFHPIAPEPNEERSVVEDYRIAGFL